MTYWLAALGGALVTAVIIAALAIYYVLWPMIRR